MPFGQRKSKNQPPVSHALLFALSAKLADILRAGPSTL